jgi:pimeloyl-ACP methyl ester carboxylesterase
MVRRDEVRAAGALAGDALGGAVAAVRDVHRAVAGRVFGALGGGAAPVRLVHDAIAGTTYGTVRAAHVVVPRVGSRVVAALAEEGSSVTTRPAGRVAVGALNGLFGDRVARRYPALALPMGLRAEGSDVALSPRSLARAYPTPTSRLVLFVHGLCESEESWSLAAARRHGERGVTYGSLLRDDLGFTPLYLRYNSGLCVSDNARALAELLEELVELWPVPVEELVLVGHSMGGLVTRGACGDGAVSGHAWTRSVRHVFSLGTPHRGAPLERGVHALCTLLDQVPEMRPAARVLDARSEGVRDLRHGTCDETHARAADAERHLRGRAGAVPSLPHASSTFVAATLVRDKHHAAARWVGDLLVQLPSALGRGLPARILFAEESEAHFGGMHHFDLLNHPVVYAQLTTWLTRPTRTSRAAALATPSAPAR